MSTAAGTLVTRVYTNFRGVDFRGDEVDLTRSPDSVNMWRDYHSPAGISTRPAMEQIHSVNGAVHGIFFFGEEMLVHAGDKLYRMSDTPDVLYTGLAERHSGAFVYGEKWYFKDGKSYLCYDGEAVSPVGGYVPTTTIGRNPSGGGSTYEDVNLLTPKRINTFLGDGESTEYYLDTTNIDRDGTVTVEVDDASTSSFTVDYEKGKITFTSPPPKPRTGGQDNVKIYFSKTAAGYRALIEKCTMLQVFDNRVFFSGNPDEPNRMWHCSLDDPSYCSDLDYYTEGLDNAPIRGMAAGNNALWVFREPSDNGSAVFYHQPTLDSDYGKIYPSTHSSVDIGCIGRAINFGDDIVFFSQRGMEGISGDVTTQQIAAHRSTLVDRKLLSEDGYRDMVLAQWEGYLLVCVGEHIYLADSRALLQNENHVEYEWFYWEMEREINCVAVRDGVLYLGCNGGVYALTDNKSGVGSHWVTAKDKFKYPAMQKTTNKRGCVVEAFGDLDMYAKTENSDFQLIRSETAVTDYMVGRMKFKKFKDMQLKFSTKSRFRLEMVSLECYIGGYIKR